MKTTVKTKKRVKLQPWRVNPWEIPLEPVEKDLLGRLFTKLDETDTITLSGLLLRLHLKEEETE